MLEQRCNAVFGYLEVQCLVVELANKQCAGVRPRFLRSLLIGQSPRLSIQLADALLWMTLWKLKKIQHSIIHCMLNSLIRRPRKIAILCQYRLRRDILELPKDLVRLSLLLVCFHLTLQGVIPTVENVRKPPIHLPSLFGYAWWPDYNLLDVFCGIFDRLLIIGTTDSEEFILWSVSISLGFPSAYTHFHVYAMLPFAAMITAGQILAGPKIFEAHTMEGL